MKREFIIPNNILVQRFSGEIYRIIGYNTNTKCYNIKPIVQGHILLGSKSQRVDEYSMVKNYKILNKAANLLYGNYQNEDE